MSQLSHDHPEEYAEIARLPPSQQNAAERALAERVLMRSAEPVLEDRVMVTKNCRDCGAEFEVPAERARHTTKWYSLCWSCLRNEM